MAPPGGPNSFNFMQFWAKLCVGVSLVDWRPNIGEILDPPLLRILMSLFVELCLSPTIRQALISMVSLLPPATKLRQGNVFTPVSHSVHGGGMHGGGACVAGEGMCGSGGHAWQGACVRFRGRAR